MRPVTIFPCRHPSFSFSPSFHVSFAVIALVLVGWPSLTSVDNVSIQGAHASNNSMVGSVRRGQPSNGPSSYSERFKSRTATSRNKSAAASSMAEGGRDPGSSYSGHEIIGIPSPGSSGQFCSPDLSTANCGSKSVHVFLSLESRNLSSIPYDLLLVGSPEGNITHLSLAHNEIKSLSSTGSNSLPSHPLSSVISLDLSHNQIKEWKVDSFGPFSHSLEYLNLSFNSLSPSLPKSAFKGLKKLKLLDLSGNNLTTLDRSDFLELNTLMTLNLSQNSLTKLPSSIFARTAQLVHLDLSYNLFKEVDSYFLKPLRFLRVINFGSNQIDSVARKAFGSNTRLRRINLGNNHLSSLHKDMFSSFTLLESLDLSHNNISKIESGAFQKLSSIRIDLSHNFITRIPRFAFIEVANVEVLDLSHNNLSSISDEAFDSSDCTTLLLNHNLFKNSSLIPLNNLTSIKFINVSHNQIEVIDRKSFTKVKLYEMATIDLSYNSIRSMSGNKFEQFWALRTLDLSHNNLTKLSSGSFGTNLPTLLELNLDDNQLKEVTSGSINGLISVKNLTMRNNRLKRVPTIPVAVNAFDLSNNSITSVSCSSFPMINSLLFINLSHNNITRLDPDSFCNLLTLRSLDLSHNQVSNIVDDVTPSIQKLSSLQNLDLSHNVITSLNTSDTFGILPSLFKVNLSSNSISEISPFTFNGLLQLQSLELSHNRLESLTLDSFKGLVSLSSLDLSYNSLSRLGNRTHSIFEDLLSLETLNLRGNRVSFITRKSLPSSPWISYKLRDLDLSYNLLESITVHDGFSSIQALNLSHNHIRKLIPGIFGNFTSLKSLDLSSNRLVTVDVGSFSPFTNNTSGLGTRSSHSPDQLASLDLANNRIVRIEPQELLALKSLKHLELSGNPMSDLPCMKQIIARMSRKGMDIKFTLLRDHEATSSDFTFCNEWLARNFKVQSSSAFLKLPPNSSMSQSDHSLPTHFHLLVAFLNIILCIAGSTL